MRKEEREGKEELSMRPVFKAELPHPVSPCVICIVSEELVLVDQTKISSSKAQCNSMRQTNEENDCVNVFILSFQVKNQLLNIEH